MNANSRACCILMVLCGCIVNGQSSKPTWAAKDFPSPAPAGSSVPRIVSGPSGKVYLSWIEAPEDGKAFRFSVWDGNHWSASRTIAKGTNVLAATSSEPGVIELPGGLLAAQWLTKAEEKDANHIVVSVSRDGGSTWSSPVKPYRDGTPGEHMYVSLFPWPGGGAGIVWLDPRGGKNTALVQTTISPAGKLGTEQVIDSDVCSCCPTSSTMAKSGPLIMFRGHTSEDIRDMRVTALVNGTWQTSHSVHDDNWKINGCPTNSGNIASRDTEVAAVWYTGGGGRKRVDIAFSSDEGHSFGKPITVDDLVPTGRPSLTLLSDESALVLWLGASGLKTRQVWPDGRVGPVVPIAQASGRKSGFPFLAESRGGAVAVWAGDEAERGTGVHSVRLTRLQE